MNFESMLPKENIEGGFKKGALFEAIFGGKMKDLLDKISKLLGGKQQEIQPNEESKSETSSLITSNTTIENKKDNTNKIASTNILGDMTYLATKYPREARSKNNNPSGITLPMSAELRGKLDEAGIQYGIGSLRPKNEGGNYVKFATMDEGLRAKKIVLMKGNMRVRDRLAKRVGHKDKTKNYQYADGILRDAKVDGNKRFSELSDIEMDRLMMKQIKQESRGLYNELLAKNITPIADNIA